MPSEPCALHPAGDVLDTVSSNTARRKADRDGRAGALADATRCGEVNSENGG